MEIRNNCSWQGKGSLEWSTNVKESLSDKYSRDYTELEMAVQSFLSFLSQRSDVHTSGQNDLKQSLAYGSNGHLRDFSF